MPRPRSKYQRAAPIKPILVAVCGNRMAGDDLFGPLVAAVLNATPFPGAQVVDLSLDPTSLMDHLEGRQALFVVDAAVGSEFRIGQLIDVDWFNARGVKLLAGTNLSTHSLSVEQQLRLAESLNALPPVVRLMALLVPDTRVGRPPRPMLQLRAVRAASQIRRHVQQILLTHRTSPQHGDTVDDQLKRT